MAHKIKRTTNNELQRLRVFSSGHIEVSTFWETFQYKNTPPCRFAIGGRIKTQREIEEFGARWAHEEIGKYGVFLVVGRKCDIVVFHKCKFSEVTSRIGLEAFEPTSQIICVLPENKFGQQITQIIPTPLFAALVRRQAKFYFSMFIVMQDANYHKYYVKSAVLKKNPLRLQFDFARQGVPFLIHKKVELQIDAEISRVAAAVISGGFRFQCVLFGEVSGEDKQPGKIMTTYTENPKIVCFLQKHITPTQVRQLRGKDYKQTLYRLLYENREIYDVEESNGTRLELFWE